MTINKKIRQYKQTRFYVDNELLKLYAPILKAHGIAIYCALAMHANSRTQYCFPSRKTIAKESGVGKLNTVDKYLNLLEAESLISVKRSPGRQPNGYYLWDYSEWKLNHTQKDTVAKINSSGKDNQPYRNSIANHIHIATPSHTSKSNNINHNFLKDKTGTKTQNQSGKGVEILKEILKDNKFFRRNNDIMKEQ